jgi:receptor-type tyrosine-protein phosphatase F
LTVQLHWSKPSQTYGELVGYRIIYGAKELNTSNEILKSASEHSHKFIDLGKLKITDTNNELILL